MKSPKQFLSMAGLSVLVILTPLCPPATTLAATTDSSSPFVQSTPLQMTNTNELPSATVWTRWHPNQYALADDGQALWIGAAGGVVRWDKSSKTYQRFTAVDGLPHQNVYAVVVDAAGNRWFGGDGGLSRLDANNIWTHFTTENSGLHNNLVDGIAVGADNTLWVSHGLPAGSISRRDPDGSWHWYPNRTTAVATDYAHIVQPQNTNQLWSVTGNEIWVDYAVYNGSAWIDRSPANGVAPPKMLAIDSKGTVWVLGPNGQVIVWKGEQWEPVSIQEQITALAIGSDDTVWVGWLQYWGYGVTVGVGRLPEITPSQAIRAFNASATALLPIGSSVWAVGSGWLLEPDGTSYDWPDVPALPNVTDMLTTNDGQAWIYSRESSTVKHGALQALWDNGTAVLGDDHWQTEHPTDDWFTAFERAPGGDLWTAWVVPGRVPGPAYLLHHHKGQWLKHLLPQGIFILDFFAEDDNHIWLVYDDATFYGSHGVLLLDIKGTPTNFTDDQWTDYPINTEIPGNAVVVDALGRLWYGDNNGLYRYEGKHWQAIQVTGGICDLTPTNKGALFAQPTPCDEHHTVVYMIGADGAIGEFKEVDALVKSNIDLARSATHRSRLWAVAPDGAIWYAANDDSDSTGDLEKLHRRTTTELTTYPLPFKLATMRSLEIDADNHVWVVADSALWRMTRKPDFDLASSPNPWLLTPNASRQGRVFITAQEGFTTTVALQIQGLPGDITAMLTPSTVEPGENVTMTLATSANTALGNYPATLIGVANHMTHTVPLTVTVVAHLFEQHLPLVGR